MRRILIVCLAALQLQWQEQMRDKFGLEFRIAKMDHAVAATYGWYDLDLGHGFHDTAQGLRYTISEPARREVLARLLALNHERYAEEVKAGLHEKKGKKTSGHSNEKVRTQMSMFEP